MSLFWTQQFSLRLVGGKQTLLLQSHPPLRNIESSYACTVATLARVLLLLRVSTASIIQLFTVSHLRWPSCLRPFVAILTLVIRPTLWPPKVHILVYFIFLYKCSLFYMFHCSVLLYEQSLCVSAISYVTVASRTRTIQHQFISTIFSSSAPPSSPHRSP